MIQTFERRKIDPNCLYGTIVAEAKPLLLIHQEYDLLFDGFVVIRKRDITKAFSSLSNIYQEKLIRKEGNWTTPSKAIRSLVLDDWKSLLTSLKGMPMVIENERQGDIWVGLLTGCDNKSAIIRNFSPCGEWQDVEHVPYRLITSIKFGDRYTTTHFRYLKAK